MARQASRSGDDPIPASGEGGRVWTDLLTDVVVDRSNRTPVIEQIQSTIRYQLASGTIPAGIRMPSVRALGSAIGVPAPTVGRAYARLREEGLLVATPGSATSVADVGQGRMDARNRIADLGAQMLDTAITRMGEAGMTPQDVRRLLETRATELWSVMSAVFVSRRGSSIAHHVVQLRAGLEGLPVQVDAVLLEDLERGSTQALASLRQADLILTPLHHRKDCTYWAGEDKQPIVLLTELSFDTHDKLLRLDNAARILLVSNANDRSTAVSILHSHGLNDNVTVAADLDPQVLAQQCRVADAIVCTQDIATMVNAVAGGVPVVSLEFQLRDESVIRLREQVAANLLNPERARP